VVGDDEQSIFRFQGAALENILEFVNFYPQAKKIVLEDNYRSGQRILDASRSVIKNNTKQIFSILNIEKNLQSQKKIISKVNLGHFSTGQTENFFISYVVKKLLKKGIDPAEICCIYREHRDGEGLAEFLSKSKIPFTQNSSDNILQDPDIKKIINLLQVIVNPDAEILFEVLHYPFFRLEIIDIYRLAHLAGIKRQSIFNLMAFGGGEKFKNKKGVQKFVKTVLNATANFANLTFASAFELLVSESGYLNYLLKLNDAPIKLNRLKSLFDEIKVLNTRRKDLSLKDFIKYIEQLEENNLKITEQPMDADFHGVKLLTVHQAKGLEFEYVFILHLTDNHWGNKKARKLIKLPSGLLKLDGASDELDEEERRLFYVALTRAKKDVYLSYADLYGEAATNTMPSKFLAEIESKYVSPVNEKIYENKYTERLKISLSPATLAPAKDLKKYLTELAERFVLSATSFNAYLDCPQQFFYNQFLRVPKMKNFSSAYGSAVHYALEMFFKKYKKDLTLPPKKYLLKSFKDGLKREILTKSETKRALNLGQKTLKEYYDFYENDWRKNVPLAIEYNFGFHNVHFGNIPITGRIDKIEMVDYAGKSVRIIDYKTTSAKSQNFLLGQTKEKDFSYLYQAFFYKLLAENDPLFDWKIKEVEFDFITPANGKFTRVNLTLDDDLYQEFLKLIGTTYNEILALNFTPDFTACKKASYDCDYTNLCAQPFISSKELLK
jgi:DNA helicase-2/ATP-dependent DNA helicase PcrA